MSRLDAKDIHLTLGGNPVLKGVSLNLLPGQLLGLIGPNGAGKTSLLRVLAGLSRPQRGSLELDGGDLIALDPRLRARRIAYLAQQGQAYWPVSVRRLVELGRLPHLDPWQQPGERDSAVVERVMGETDILHLRDRSIDTLSGGERVRALLARALAVEPRILLADEPVAALDPAHQLQVMSLLRKHCDSGGSAVVVLHDLTLAAHYCHRLQLLCGGETLASGDADQVLTVDHLKQAYGILPDPSLTSPIEAFRLGWDRVEDGDSR